MKMFLIKTVQSLAHRVTVKYKPTVVGITGSVGKTATKEAVFAVLARKYRTRKNIGNYNTEIGLPLTVLGVRSPGRSLFGWLRVLWRGCSLLWFTKKNYPEMLVLEMGADRPGDIELLLSIVTPSIGVITGIAPVHTEQFGSIEAIAKEKGKLFKAIASEGWVIANADDARVAKLASQSSARAIRYSTGNTTGADIKAAEIAISYSNESATGVNGMSFKIIGKGTVTPMLRRGVIGEHQVYPALAAAAVAQALGMNMVDVAEAVRSLEPIPGRMRVLPGIKHTILVDDTYNASPDAMMRALEATALIERSNSKLYAVLGDMLELGNRSENEHRRIGTAVASLGYDALIAVGERSRDILRGAEEAGMSRDYLFHFRSTGEAGLFVQKRIEQGDVILIKGSRGIRCERITKEIMAEPERARTLLV